MKLSCSLCVGYSLSEVPSSLLLLMQLSVQLLERGAGMGTATRGWQMALSLNPSLALKVMLSWDW